MKRNHSLRLPIASVLAILMLFTVILPALTTKAYADGNFQYSEYLYPYSHQGTVVCSQLTVRSSPSTNASSIGKLKNGKSCIIAGEYGDWLIIDLSSCGFSNNSYGYGFAKKGLIKNNPYWIVLTKYTEMFATPWQTENLKNGEQSGRVLLVVEEQYPFYAVQCKENSAGSSFIYQWDVGRYSHDGQNLYVCVEDKVPIYDSPYGRQTQTIDKFTIVNVSGYNGDYWYVTINPGEKNESTGWVQRQYVQQIIN